jgi:hypothetical protein
VIVEQCFETVESRTEPRDDVRALRIYERHERDLMVLLAHLQLVDAKLIDPKSEITGVRRMLVKMSKERTQRLADATWFVVQEDRALRH